MKERKKTRKCCRNFLKLQKKVVVANMVLSDKEYEAEEKNRTDNKDNSKSNEEKEKESLRVLEELKNNTGNDEQNTILRISS